MYRCRKPVQSSRGVVVELSPGALYSAKQNLIFTVFPSNILAENCENEIKKKMTPLRSLMEQRWRWRAGGRKLASISTTAVHPRAQIRYTHARTHTHTHTFMYTRTCTQKHLHKRYKNRRHYHKQHVHLIFLLYLLFFSLLLVFFLFLLPLFTNIQSFNESINRQTSGVVV